MTQTTFLLSRRGFAKILGAGAAYTALQPSLLLSTGARSRSIEAVSGNNFVRLSSNENPYGPAPAALKAMTDAFNLAWRYPDEYAELLVADIAQLHTVSAQNIILGDGSGEILKLAAAALIAPPGDRLLPSL